MMQSPGPTRLAVPALVAAALLALPAVVTDGLLRAQEPGADARADVGAVAMPSVGDYSAVTAEMLLDPPAEEWLMWRRTYDAQAFSPLDRIDTTNVGSLRLAWAWTMEPGMQETTPLVHDGVMFLPQSCDFLEAVDARDGTLLWEYRRERRAEHPASLACANRNAALYEDRIYIGTHDAFLVALDARTGEVVWEEQVGDWTVGQHYSGGPMIVNDQVVAGMSGCSQINSSCWISAHDPDTGNELWRTYTIAQRGDPGYDTWGGVPDDQRWGGSAWMAPSFDPELNLIFLGTAVPIPWGQVQRGTESADLLYTNSTLALDADTGEIVWHFQHLPGDNWDQDHPFERIVVETEIVPDPDEVEWINPELLASPDGGAGDASGDPASGAIRRKVVTGAFGKPGVIWSLDAATGEFLWARSTNLQNVIVGVDAEGRKGIANPDLPRPRVGEEILVCPMLAGGGINWQAVAYSPGTNALYAPTNDTCMEYTLNEVTPEIGAYHGSASYTRVPVPGDDGMVGRFTAVDAATGATLWEHQQRAGIGGSVLATAGGLVFVTDDARRFRAFHAATGEILWEQILNASAGGYPVSYELDGVQYIAIAAGGGPNYRSITPEIRQRRGGNVLYVFRLP